MNTFAMGCCGACCQTCPERGKTCKGCQTGYADGSRNLNRAKCKIKICCIRKGYVSCADCADWERCPTLQACYGHTGYKYGKYRRSIAYIRDHGYAAFWERAAGWTGACGKL